MVRTTRSTSRLTASASSSTHWSSIRSNAASSPRCADREAASGRVDLDAARDANDEIEQRCHDERHDKAEDGVADWKNHDGARAKRHARDGAFRWVADEAAAQREQRNERPEHESEDQMQESGDFRARQGSHSPDDHESAPFAIGLAGWVAITARCAGPAVVRLPDADK